MKAFTETKKALRELVERHYDYNLSDKEQSGDTRAALAAEVRHASVVTFIIADSSCALGCCDYASAVRD
jgi:hypothetical protein